MEVYCLLFHWILDLYGDYGDFSRHDPHTDRKAAAEDNLSDLPPADLCVWTDGSVPTTFGPVGAGLLFYATFARTQHHFPSPTVQFHPASQQKSQPSVMPLDGASNITPLAKLSPRLSLQIPSSPSPSWTLPLTSLPPMLRGQSGSLSLPIWFDQSVLLLDPWPLRYTRMAVRYGTLVRCGKPQFLLRTTVRWYGTLFL